MNNFFKAHKNIILTLIVLGLMGGNFMIFKIWWPKNIISRVEVDQFLSKSVSTLLGIPIKKVADLPAIPTNLVKDVLNNVDFLSLRLMPQFNEIKPAELYLPPVGWLDFGQVSVVAVNNASSLMIAWEKLPATEWPLTAIYRSTVFGNLGEKVGEAEAMSFNWIDRNIKSGQEYFYSLRPTQDSGGQIELAQYPGRTLDLIPPPAPKAVVLASAKDGRIEINWQNPQVPDFAFNRLYRSTLPGQIGKLIADKVKDSRYVDEKITAGVSYYYTVTAVDAVGNESSRQIPAALREELTASGSVLVRGDIILLLRNVKVENSGSGEQISLSWQNPVSENFNGVRIYRSTVFNVLGELLAITPRDSAGFVDNKVTKEQIYYYTLRTVDTSGNESDNMIQYVAQARDVIGPLPPSSVVATQEEPTKVLVTWQQTNANDLAYYRLYRSYDEKVIGPLVADKVMGGSWFDYKVVDNVVYYYTVTAVDTSGNESARPLSTGLRQGRIPLVPLRPMEGSL